MLAFNAGIAACRAVGRLFQSLGRHCAGSAIGVRAIKVGRVFVKGGGAVAELWRIKDSSDRRVYCGLSGLLTGASIRPMLSYLRCGYVN